VVVVVLSTSRSVANVPSVNSRRPEPRTSGWIKRRYSSIRSCAISDRMSSPLPRITRSLSSCRFSSATASAASPFRSVEFLHSSGSRNVRDATYLVRSLSTFANMSSSGW